jgi:holin-like protein
MVCFMVYMVQLALIFSFCMVGDLIASLLPITMPGSVISMLLVLLLLASRILKEQHIRQSADFLLENMTFFFIPPAVSILRYATIVKTIWWQLFVINIVSVVVCFALSSWTVMLTLRLMRRRHD